MPQSSPVRGCARVRPASLLLLLWLGGSCSSPTRPEADTSAFPGGGHPVSLQLTGPASIVVREQVLLDVTAEDMYGNRLVTSGRVSFSSSDPTVGSVSPSGVVLALGRGSATISARIDTLVATVAIRAVARVRIVPVPPAEWPGAWPLAIGDTLQFSAEFVDINGGHLIDRPDSTVWSSSLPDQARVEDGGRVIALAPSAGAALISVWTPDGSGYTYVDVLDIDGSQPATIRFAHAAKGIGPITFVPNKGDPVTLSYGEFVDRQIRPGLVDVHVNGLVAGQYQVLGGSSMYPGLIRSNDRLALYAAGGPADAWVAHVWYNPMDIPADSGAVRLVQGWTEFPVVSLRPTGAPPSGIRELCYFDPGEVSGFFTLPAGAFDLLLETKYGSYQFVRLPGTAVAGHEVTLVLTGFSAADVGVLTFPDP